MFGGLQSGQSVAYTMIIPYNVSINSIGITQTEPGGGTTNKTGVDYENGVNWAIIDGGSSYQNILLSTAHQIVGGAKTVNLGINLDNASGSNSRILAFCVTFSQVNGGSAPQFGSWFEIYGTRNLGLPATPAPPPYQPPPPQMFV
jgi:hypothetical protein